MYPEMASDRYFSAGKIVAKANPDPVFRGNNEIGANRWDWTVTRRELRYCLDWDRP